MFASERQKFEPCRKQLEAMPGVTVDWEFFENDLEAANHNCRNDPNRPPEHWKGSIDHNNRWSPMYTIPPNVNARIIFKIQTRIDRGTLGEPAVSDEPRGQSSHEGLFS